MLVFCTELGHGGRHCFLDAKMSSWMALARELTQYRVHGDGFVLGPWCYWLYTSMHGHWHFCDGGKAYFWRLAGWF